MINMSLTSEQKTVLEAWHWKIRNGRERDRMKAVLLRSQGWLLAKITPALRKSEAGMVWHSGD